MRRPAARIFRTQPSGPTRRVFPAAVRGHGRRRRRAVYVAGDGRPDASVYERLEAVAESRPTRSTAGSTSRRRNVVFVGVDPGVRRRRPGVPRPGGAGRRTGTRPATACGRTDARSSSSRRPTPRRSSSSTCDGTVRLSTLAEPRGPGPGDRGVLRDGLVAHDRPERLRLDADRLADDHGRDAALRPGRRRPAGRRSWPPTSASQRVDRIVLERTGLGETGATYLVGAGRRLIQGTAAAGDVRTRALRLGRDRSRRWPSESGDGPLRRRPRHAGDRRLPLARRPRGRR